MINVGSLLQSNVDHYKAEAGTEYRAVDHSYIQDGETVRSGHDVLQIPAQCLAGLPSALFLSAEQPAAQWVPVWGGGTQSCQERGGDGQVLLRPALIRLLPRLRPGGGQPHDGQREEEEVQLRELLYTQRSQGRSDHVHLHYSDRGRLQLRPVESEVQGEDTLQGRQLRHYGEVGRLMAEATDLLSDEVHDAIEVGQEEISEGKDSSSAGTEDRVCGGRM